MFNFLQINLPNLIENLYTLKSLHKKKTDVVAMVKGNAYGHGLQEISQCLSPYVEYFGVASLDEAIALRVIKIKNKVLVFSYFDSQEQVALLCEYSLTPVIHSRYQYDIIKNFILKGLIDPWFNVNTGMNTTGVDFHEFNSIYQDIKKYSNFLSINVISHLSEPHDVTYVKKQLDLFSKCIEGKELNKVSISATATINQSLYNTIRPGIGLYGIDPIGKDLFLKPVMSFKTKIISIKKIDQGEYIGYNREFCTLRKTSIAILSVGYYAGYPRLKIFGAQVFINGILCNIVGQVSMDVLTVDITGFEDKIKIGDIVELWGENININTIAKCAQTIPYTLITGVSESVKRIYTH